MRSMNTSVCRRLVFAGAILLVSTAAVAEIRRNLYRNEAAGFEFSKPKGWFFAGEEWVRENQKHLRLKDEEFEERLRAAKGPLVSALKFPATHAGVNPVFQVSVVTLDDWALKTPRKMVEDLVEGIGTSFEDLRYVDDPRETKIGGRDGARAGVTLTRGVSDGSNFHLRSDFIIVPRGQYMFIIGLSREVSDSSSGQELEAILATFEFLD